MCIYMYIYITNNKSKERSRRKQLNLLHNERINSRNYPQGFLINSRKHIVGQASFENMPFYTHDDFNFQ